jgi:hypothetical protein
LGRMLNCLSCQPKAVSKETLCLYVSPRSIWQSHHVPAWFELALVCCYVGLLSIHVNCQHMSSDGTTRPSIMLCINTYVNIVWHRVFKVERLLQDQTASPVTEWMKNGGVVIKNRADYLHSCFPAAPPAVIQATLRISKDEINFAKEVRCSSDAHLNTNISGKQFHDRLFLQGSCPTNSSKQLYAIPPPPPPGHTIFYLRYLSNIFDLQLNQWLLCTGLFATST